MRHERQDDEHDVVSALRDALRDGLYLARAVYERPVERSQPEVGLESVPVGLLWCAADDEDRLSLHHGE
jgi:hypothetical protein